MSNANSSGARTRSRLLALTLGTLALALALNTIAASAAHAGGAAGGIVGSKNSQGKHNDFEASGRKPGAASGSGA